MNVWVLRYTGDRCCGGDDIIGVYALEEIARHDGIIEAKKNPNIRPYEVEWHGARMLYNCQPAVGQRANWLLVDTIVLEEWDVTE